MALEACAWTLGALVTALPALALGAFFAAGRFGVEIPEAVIASTGQFVVWSFALGGSAVLVLWQLARATQPTALTLPTGGLPS